MSVAKSNLKMKQPHEEVADLLDQHTLSKNYASSKNDVIRQQKAHGSPSSKFVWHPEENNSAKIPYEIIRGYAIVHLGVLAYKVHCHEPVDEAASHRLVLEPFVPRTFANHGVTAT